MNKLFQEVGGARPGKSVFDLSYEKKFTCEMGQLIPIMHDEVVPGDIFDIGNQSVIRFQAMVAPALQEIDAVVHYFFVPYRILWDDWEDFITGGEDGTFADPPPRWSPTNTAAGSLWDLFGLPVGVTPTDALPLDFPRIAYNRIYNEYYRDENLIAKILETNEAIRNVAWEKDYFTSAQLSQQKGTAPSLPLSGTGAAIFPGAISLTNQPLTWPAVDTGGGSTPINVGITLRQPYSANDKTALEKGKAGVTIPKANLDNNVVDFSGAGTFTVNDLRLAFQLQKWMERSQRAGSRYCEALRVHFNVAPRDDRLQRPEYIGGSKTPIIISEVLQTSSTDATTPQGNLAGHGMSVDRSFIARYRAEEHGIIMGLFSIRPKPGYMQGVDRQWLRRTRFDFFWPEFVGLAEQEIERAEIYASAVGAENRTVFGYAGRYDEMRVKRNLICSGMRTTYDYWHLARKFTAAPELNEDFITLDPAETRRIFAVESEPGCIVSFGNRIRAIRPMPTINEPGLIDHF